MTAGTFLLKNVITQFFWQTKTVGSLHHFVIFAIAANHQQHELTQGFSYALGIDGGIAVGSQK